MPEIFPIGNFVLRAIAWASIRLVRIRNKFSDPGERREGYRRATGRDTVRSDPAGGLELRCGSAQIRLTLRKRLRRRNRTKTMSYQTGWINYNWRNAGGYWCFRSMAPPFTRRSRPVCDRAQPPLL